MSVEDEIKTKILFDQRPWGFFKQYAHNQQCTVKIITVERGGILSSQSHEHRDELWVVLDEGLQVELDGKVLNPAPGEEIVIRRGTIHRLSSKSGTGRVMEISFGEFDEDDIIRYDDVYGRA
ncbi:MAG: phosphomannose isomerase type II C-terminal cupin domain [bacterium]